MWTCRLCCGGITRRAGKNAQIKILLLQPKIGRTRAQPKTVGRTGARSIRLPATTEATNAYAHACAGSARALGSSSPLILVTIRFSHPNLFNYHLCPVVCAPHRTAVSCQDHLPSTARSQPETQCSCTSVFLGSVRTKTDTDCASCRSPAEHPTCTKRPQTRTEHTQDKAECIGGR